MIREDVASRILAGIRASAESMGGDLSQYLARKYPTTVQKTALKEEMEAFLLLQSETMSEGKSSWAQAAEHTALSVMHKSCSILCRSTQASTHSARHIVSEAVPTNHTPTFTLAPWQLSFDLVASLKGRLLVCTPMPPLELCGYECVPVLRVGVWVCVHEPVRVCFR
jgi:hypothetical protein